MRRMQAKVFPRRKWFMIAVAVLVGAGAMTGFALASWSGSAPPSTLWTWTNRVVPGTPIAASANVGNAASQAGVDPSVLRAAAVASDGLTLLFGRNSNGDLCSADASSAVVSGFNCLSNWSDKFALLLYSTDGGSRRGVVDHASVVGVARPDVGRVTLTTASGAEDLPLNQWNGFAYAGSSASDLPLSITAYDANGQSLETEQIESAPASH